jgi:DNA-3-methyladenine glycosylase II
MKEEEEIYLKTADPTLGKIMTAIPPLNIISTNSVFHDLMSCILEQQIHYRSTKNVFQKMLDKANIKLLTPDNFAKFEKKGLEGTRLSMQKYETVSRIIQHWDKSVVWADLSDDEIRNRLSHEKGIGNWTIDMILIFTLGRPNVFSYDDYHIKQIMTSLYKLNPKSKLKAQMIEVSEAWAPHKSTAFKYLLSWKKKERK